MRIGLTTRDDIPPSDVGILGINTTMSLTQQDFQLLEAKWFLESFSQPIGHHLVIFISRNRTISNRNFNLIFVINSQSQMRTSRITFCQYQEPIREKKNPWRSRGCLIFFFGWQIVSLQHCHVGNYKYSWVNLRNARYAFVNKSNYSVLSSCCLLEGDIFAHFFPFFRFQCMIKRIWNCLIYMRTVNYHRAHKNEHYGARTIAHRWS